MWSFETKTNSVQQNIGTLMGAYWGAVLDRSYILGIGGNVNLSHTVTNYSYFQLLAQYVHQTDNLLHYAGRVSLGAGSVKDYEHAKTSLFDNFFNTSGTAFFFVEPQVNAELNVTATSRLTLGISYFAAFGLDEKSVHVAKSKLTNQDLSGVNLTVALTFGKY